MKPSAEPLHTPRLWWVLRWMGVVLSAVPVLLMLVTGLVGSAVSGQLHMDLFLPAELSLLTFPGMILMAVAAVKQRVYPRLSAALPVVAAAALLLCQGVALLSGIASGLRDPQGPLLSVLTGLLLLFDLASIAAPVVGLLAAQRLGRTTP